MAIKTIINLFKIFNIPIKNKINFRVYILFKIKKKIMKKSKVH